jgi:integrase
MRGRHPHAKDPALFIGTKGRLGPSGVLIMLRRRGGQAGIPKLHAHTFRHSWAHSMLSSGATEGDVMALGGWKSRDMLDRYGSVARSERAIEAHRKLSPADRLRRS